MKFEIPQVMTTDAVITIDPGTVTGTDPVIVTYRVIRLVRLRVKYRKGKVPKFFTPTGERFWNFRSLSTQEGIKECSDAITRKFRRAGAYNAAKEYSVDLIKQRIDRYIESVKGNPVITSTRSFNEDEKNKIMQQIEIKGKEFFAD